MQYIIIIIDHQGKFKIIHEILKINYIYCTILLQPFYQSNQHVKEVGARHTYNSEAYINIRSIYVVWVLCCSDEAKFNAIELIYKGDRSNVQGYNNVTNTVVTMETPQGMMLKNLFLPLLTLLVALANLWGSVLSVNRR